MRAQTVNFERTGTPYEKLGIGRHSIRRALLNNPTTVDSMHGDWTRGWFENDLPEAFLEDLEYEHSDPLAFTDYYSFDDDYYLETEIPDQEDYDDFYSDFKGTGPVISLPRKSGGGVVYWQPGVLPDGSKVIKYSDGMSSGYIAKKDWLK